MTPTRIALAAGLLALAFSSGAQTAAKKIYIVQLADAPAATYAGGIAGLAATRPALGAKLNASAPSVRAYAGYLATKRNAELARLGRVPTLHTYSYTFNGFSAQLTDAQVKTLRSSSNVKSVVESALVRADTTRTPGFLGLNAPGGLWSQLDPASRLVLGEDIIIGVLDTGIWPEDRSFGDKVDALSRPVAYHEGGTSAYGPAPAKWKGACVTGPGFTAAMCNNKLLGARFYGDAWYAAAAASGGAYSAHPTLEYKSPRDGGGHGSHTASTAGGNANVETAVNGTAVGAISGMAPRARLAAYKVLWTASDTALGPGASHDGGQTPDILKAIDDAVADGVDVINYSISGTQTNFNDPVEVAFLNATAAGVFVAASAGNNGPGNQVAHMSPWLMTVAASTHDRQALADLTLGNGALYSGVSVYGGTLPGTLVLASSIPAPGAAVADAQRCFANALNAAGAAGKIVVCDRGVSARVDKSAEVKRAGGIGMVLVNASAAADDLVADFHSVPSVHLKLATRTDIYAYVGSATPPTGTIAPPASPPPAVAPVMASFSSRGPNRANPNILKPDLTGPGVDVVAAYIDDSAAQQAQHDATANGSFTPAPNANQISGTSMSSPHVAGLAALLKQQRPGWSPAAIKSALMTTTTGVKLASGAVDTNRWGYGAGHVNPNAASVPGLVYDATAADYGRFLCGIGLAPPAGIGSCAGLGSVQPYNLNLASITAASVPGTLTMTRKVTNVSGATRTYLASIDGMTGWDVVVSPPSLTLASGASAEFDVTVTRASAALNTWTFGTLTWSDGLTQVRSPLSVRAVGFLAPALVSDTRSSGAGTKMVPIVSTYTGSLSVATTGLVPATRLSATIATGQTQCYNIAVPPGAKTARFQLFNSDTEGGSSTDLDMEVFNGPDGTGSSVGSSGGGTSDELVALSSPAAGTYSACVIGYSATGGKAYTLSSWVVGPAVGTQSLRASAPRQVFTGGSASVGLGWSVTAGHRYLGLLEYFDNTSALIGASQVWVDNH